MYLINFEKYLFEKRKISESSIKAYLKDVEEFQNECLNRGVENLLDVESDIVATYIMELQQQNKSKATINRKLTSIRVFYKFLIGENLVSQNPTQDFKTARMERKTIEYLSIEEVEQILEAPKNNMKGIRDKAILELLYATGIRVNELISANLEDVNTRIGFFTCKGDKGKARIVPLGRLAKKAMEIYLEDARDMLIKNNKSENALFVNSHGYRMTRQGLWKILKTYGREVGLEHKITPHIFRTSFAVHMIQNGADLKSLQELLGHEDGTAMQVYMFIKKNRIKDVYDRTHPRA